MQNAPAPPAGVGSCSSVPCELSTESPTRHSGHVESPGVWQLSNSGRNKKDAPKALRLLSGDAAQLEWKKQHDRGRYSARARP